MQLYGRAWVEMRVIAVFFGPCAPAVRISYVSVFSHDFKRLGRLTKLATSSRGDGIGYSGYKHQKGEKVIAITDNNGYVLAPLPVAPVNETDMVLLPKGLKALKQVAKKVDLDLRGAYLNLNWLRVLHMRLTSF
jgi:hypothetical protein